MTLCRYLAVIGPSRLDHERRTKRALDAANRCLGGQASRFETPSLSVAYTGPAVRLEQPHRALLILGDAFGSLGADRLEGMPDERLQRVWESEGRDLIDSLWGRFIAFISDDSVSSPSVLREPSAGQPCYYVAREGLIFVASDVQLLTECAGLRPSIDLTEVAGHLLFNQLRRPRTCLIGVDELLGGHRLAIEHGQPKVEQIWSPWRYADRAASIKDDGEASSRLRETIQGCVQSLASPYRRVILSLSGGLDSSIVAACLATARPKLTCLTMATHEANGDERLFARSAAEAAGAPLIEFFETEEWVDLERCDAAHLPRPISRAFNQSIDRANRQAADQVGADAFFGGAGGDNVFCFLQSAAPIADCLLDWQFDEAWRTAQNIGALAGVSTYAALHKSFARAWLRSPGFQWRPDLSFLPPGVAELSPELRQHPWLEAPPDAYPGKAGHIASIMNIQNHLEGFARERDRPVVAPLMAQPIMELCLRIPSWMWCRDGRDRAVARAAFCDVVPSSILDRRTKGTPESFVARLFQRNRKKITEMLLDGELAGTQLIDKAALAGSLEDTGLVKDAAFVRIMGFLDVEMWLRAQRLQTSSITE